MAAPPIPTACAWWHDGGEPLPLETCEWEFRLNTDTDGARHWLRSVALTGSFSPAKEKRRVPGRLGRLYVVYPATSATFTSGILFINGFRAGVGGVLYSFSLAQDSPWSPLCGLTLPQFNIPDEILLWENIVLQTPDDGPIYADWLDERGIWPERVNALRSSPIDPKKLYGSRELPW